MLEVPSSRGLSWDDFLKLIKIWVRLDVAKIVMQIIAAEYDNFVNYAVWLYFYATPSGQISLLG